MKRVAIIFLSLCLLGLCAEQPQLTTLEDLEITLLEERVALLKAKLEILQTTTTLRKGEAVEVSEEEFGQVAKMEEAWGREEGEYRRSRFEVKRSRVVIQSGGVNDQYNRMVSVKSEHVIYNGES